MAVKPLLSNVERNILSAEPNTPLNKFAGIVVRLLAILNVSRNRGCWLAFVPLPIVGNTDPIDPDTDLTHLDVLFVSVL